MLIENALSNAVRFLHMNALSSPVGLKVDFNMALLVNVSGLDRLLAEKMRGYRDAHAGCISRGLINIPAAVTIDNREVTVQLHRHAHLAITVDSGILRCALEGVRWNNMALRLTAWKAGQNAARCSSFQGEFPRWRSRPVCALHPSTSALSRELHGPPSTP